MLKTAEDIRQLNERISHAGQFIDRLREEIGHVIVGQSHMLDRLLIGLTEQWSCIAGRSAGTCKNTNDKIAGAGHSCKIQPNTIYP